jgi:TIR domain
MDVEGRIKPGDDFVEILREQISGADIVLIIIGRRWLDLLSARKEDPDDFNLIEIEAAIAQRKRVVPVLVGGASMPRADSLPKSIQSLARRQAVRLSVDRFRADCVDLVGAMKEILRKT